MWEYTIARRQTSICHHGALQNIGITIQIEIEEVKISPVLVRTIVQKGFGLEISGNISEKHEVDA